MTNKTINFADLSSELDVIMLKLKDEKTSIEESLVLYEKGMVLVDQLSDYLTSSLNRLHKINERSNKS